MNLLSLELLAVLGSLAQFGLKDYFLLCCSGPPESTTPVECGSSYQFHTEVRKGKVFTQPDWRPPVCYLASTMKSVL